MAKGGKPQAKDHASEFSSEGLISIVSLIHAIFLYKAYTKTPLKGRI